MREPLINAIPRDETRCRTGICLNMIVKNESRVIERLLRTVHPYIDYYVIVDTGSTDDTPERIGRVMGEFSVPGEVHFREWINFGHNRQQALELAVAAGRGDWLLFIDADEELGVSNPEFYAELERGVSYHIEKRHGELRYAVSHLLDISENGWEWRGPAHNYIVHMEGPGRRARRDDVWIIYHSGQGAKSHGLTQREKYIRDAGLFEAELEKHPGDARSRFYLAQSWRDAGEYEKAYTDYAQRVDMGGWAEEVYVAQFEKARLSIRLGRPHDEIVAEHLKAYSLRPSRAEALWSLAAHCRRQKRYAEGYLFAGAGKGIPVPDDILFVRRDVYEWRLLDEFTICAYWIGRYHESAAAAQRILRQGHFPESKRKRLRANLDFALEKLGAGYVTSTDTRESRELPAWVESESDSVTYVDGGTQFREPGGNTMSQKTKSIDLELMKNQKFFIATPCYGGNVTEPYLHSLMKLISFSAKHEITICLETIVNESLVPRARNNLVAGFMKTDCTHLVFIDADIAFSVDDFMRLYAADKDVVVGAYPKKSIEWEQVKRQIMDQPEGEQDLIQLSGADYAINVIYSDPEARTVEVVDGLVRVLDAGTGFMMIRRAAIEKLIDAHPELKYDGDQTVNDPEKACWLYALFDTMIEDSSRRYLSEDFTFCRRWQEIGGEIWLDPEIALTHFGTMPFRGHPARFFKRR